MPNAPTGTATPQPPLPPGLHTLLAASRGVQLVLRADGSRLGASPGAAALEASSIGNRFRRAVARVAADGRARTVDESAGPGDARRCRWTLEPLPLPDGTPAVLATALAPAEPAAPADRSAPSEAPGSPASTATVWPSMAAALDAMPDGVGLYRAILDADGAFIDMRPMFLNDVARRRWLGGGPADGLYGGGLFEQFPFLRDRFFEAFAGVAVTGEGYRARVPMAMPDGDRVIEVSVTRYDGGLIHVDRDVTDEMRGSEALHESEDRLRRMMEGIEAIISYREPGSTIATLSAQAERLLGYPAALIASYEAWESIVHPDDLPMAKAAWTGSGDAWDMEYRVRRADGALLWLSDRGRRIWDGERFGSFGVLTDRTASHEADARFRAVMDSAVDGIVTIDEAARIVDANPSAGRIYGAASPADLLGRPISDLVPDSALATHRDRVPDVVRAGGAAITGAVTAVTGRRLDGTEFPAEVSLSTWSVDGHGFVTAFVRDMTERRRAEQAARAADERFHRILDANLFGVSIAEASGRVHEANDYWLRVVGIRRDELERGEADWRALTAPEYLDADDRSIDQVSQFGSAPPLRKEMLRRDGTRVPVVVARISMPGSDGLLATLVLDLSATERATRMVPQLVAAIDQTIESVVITDTHGAIQYVNPAFQRTTGYTANEVIGVNPRVLQSGVHSRAFYEAMWGRLLAGETWRGELINRRRDGTHYTEVASISPIRDASGTTTAYVAVKRDVTAERDLDLKARQGQRLDILGQLAGGVAHDFNNLLAAIRGYGELVRDSIEPGTPARADADEVLRAADRAAGLTRQLLAFSRRQAVSPEPVEPAAIVAEATSMLRRLVGEHIELVTRCDPHAGMVLADPGAIEQLVMNLVLNARDAMPDGGELMVRVERVPADPPQDARVRITVSDTGTGMDEATRARIFEPFFTTKEPGRGTGLGLATVYGIVQATKGEIHVESTPGAGSRFVIELPLTEAPAPGTEATLAPGLGGHGETILLVEDEPAARAVVGRILERSGYQVLAAGTGSEALGIARERIEGIDLLLTDVRMPGMQGPQLARQVVAMAPDLPVIFMSGFTEDESFAAVDGARLIDKPFASDALGRAIRDALDHARAANPA